MAGWLEKWQPGPRGCQSGDRPSSQPECADQTTRVDGSVIQRNTGASRETLRGTDERGQGRGRREPGRGVGRDLENQRGSHRKEGLSKGVVKIVQRWGEVRQDKNT